MSRIISFQSVSFAFLLRRCWLWWHEWHAARFVQLLVLLSVFVACLHGDCGLDCESLIVELLDLLADDWLHVFLFAAVTFTLFRLVTVFTCIRCL